MNSRAALPENSVAHLTNRGAEETRLEEENTHTHTQQNPKQNAREESFLVAPNPSGPYSILPSKADSIKLFKR